MKYVLRVYILLLVLCFLLSCAGEAEKLPIMEIEQLYSLEGNPLDFDVVGNTLYVAEGFYGFSIHNVSTAEEIHRVTASPYQTFPFTAVRLIRYYQPFQVLVIYDQSNGHALYNYQYRENDGELIAGPFRVFGALNSARDMIFESIPDDISKIRIIYGYYNNDLNNFRISHYDCADITAVPVLAPVISTIIPNSIYSLDIFGGDYFVGAMGQRGVVIFNRADLSTLAYCHTPGSARGVRVKDNIVYIANHSAGLRIADLSDVANPVLLGKSYDTGGNATSLDFFGNYLAVGTTNAGLYLFDISNPVNPKPIDRIRVDVTGEISKVKFSGGSLFVASQNLGIMRIVVSS